MNKNYPFNIDTLPYAYDALEPVIDKQTMEIHHDRHHQAYCDNLNKLISEKTELQGVNLEGLLKSEVQAVKNNAGGVWNHDFFWSVMASQGNNLISDSFKAVLSSKFGSFESFQGEFEKAALTRFGSGWAWLVKNSSGELEIVSTANQDSPVAEGKTPLLAIDVWEHAYYLKYQNKRADYVKSWWAVVNWHEVERLYQL